MSENLIRVAQFNGFVKQLIEGREELKNIAVFGEVSGFGVTRGTAYFSVKDTEASLACVKFGITETGYIPKDGDMVIVRGSANYYVKGGRFSFNVYKIEPYGQGVLYAQFLELKNRLEAEGLFSAERKVPLPKYVRRIGVVTSPTGAVVQDIIDITRRRNPSADIVIFPSKVQGVGADIEIAAGIAVLDKTDVDVIIVARGGGSAEDLSPFNTELVARAIAAAKKPVVSAVGHETDFTITDFVADMRAATPSVAAEQVVFDLNAELGRISGILRRVEALVSGAIRMQWVGIEGLARRLAHESQSVLAGETSCLRESALALRTAVVNMINENVSSLKMLTGMLEAKNPQKILASGYARIESAGTAVSSVNGLEINQELNIILYDGSIDAAIQKINKKAGKK
ncbi:MAG: exodeoxyribonuclease VII large subunit [Firmicutes bacterium]|nr:exodeoxyribonuclease VII large subunit [Bacillota bacterium]